MCHVIATCLIYCYVFLVPGLISYYFTTSCFVVSFHSAMASETSILSGNTGTIDDVNDEDDADDTVSTGSFLCPVCEKQLASDDARWQHGSTEHISRRTCFPFSHHAFRRNTGANSGCSSQKCPRGRVVWIQGTAVVWGVTKICSRMVESVMEMAWFFPEIHNSININFWFY